MKNHNYWLIFSTSLFLLVFLSFSNLSAMFDNGRREILGLSNFNEIAFHTSGQLYFQQGNTSSVSVEASDELFEKLEIISKNGILHIKMKKLTNFFSSNDNKIIVYVTVKDLNAVQVSGSGKATGKGRIEANDLKLEVSGSGSLTIQTDASRIQSSVSGSGNIKLAGKSEALKASVSGSGKMDGSDLKTDFCSATVSGSGNCKVNVRKKLDVHITGSGNVYYTGGTEHINQKISGSGKLKKILETAYVHPLFFNLLAAFNS